MAKNVVLKDADGNELIPQRHQETVFLDLTDVNYGTSENGEDIIDTSLVTRNTSLIVIDAEGSETEKPYIDLTHLGWENAPSLKIYIMNFSTEYINNIIFKFNDSDGAMGYAHINYPSSDVGIFEATATTLKIEPKDVGIIFCSIDVISYEDLGRFYEIKAFYEV